MSAPAALSMVLSSEKPALKTAGDDADVPISGCASNPGKPIEKKTSKALGAATTVAGAAAAPKNTYSHYLGRLVTALNRFARAPKKIDNQPNSRQTSMASISDEPKIWDCCILGAGISGLTAAGCLIRRGESNFCVLEARSQVGGTWFDHDYPGAGTDTEVQSYAPTFKPLRSVHQYATRDEIFDYCIELGNDIPRNQMFLNTQILAAEFASATGLWTVKTNRGEFLSRIVINCAVGNISKNFVKDAGWSGKDKFKGRVLHSSHLSKDVTIFEQKRVAIVGMGATTTQLAPAIMPVVASIDILHRTKPYILRCKRRKISHNPIMYTLNRWLYELRNDVYNFFDGRLGLEWILRYPVRWLNYGHQDTPLLPPSDQPVHCTRRNWDYNGFKDLLKNNKLKLVDIRKTQVSYFEKGLVVGDEYHEYDVVVLAIGYDIGMASFPIKVDDKSVEMSSTALHGGFGMFEELPNYFWPYTATGAPLAATTPPRLVEDGMVHIIPLIQHMSCNGYGLIRPSKFLVSMIDEGRRKELNKLSESSVVLSTGCHSTRYLVPTSFTYGNKPVYKRDARFLQGYGPTRLFARFLAFIFLRPRFFDYSVVTNSEEL